MVESVGVGVGIYDQDGQYLYVNDSYADLFSVSPAKLIGVEIWEIASDIDPEQFDGYWNSFDDGETRQAETNHTYNGHDVPVETITTQRTIDGTEYHFGTIKDITERKARQQEIKQQNERLQSFTGIVSHDLRNPLSVAHGYVELLQEDIDRSELQLVKNSLDRMDVLITELLRLAQSNEPVGEMDTVSLFQTAKQAWDSVSTADSDLHLSGSEDTDPRG